jgi:hypothetical protein
MNRNLLININLADRFDKKRAFISNVDYLAQISRQVNNRSKDQERTYYFSGDALRHSYQYIWQILKWFASV